MVNIIITLIICATVIYCIRMYINAAFVADEAAHTTDDTQGITEEELDKAYDDMRKRGEIPPDLVEFMQAMQQDFE